MDRRGFLRLLGVGAAAAVAPTKTFAFFGGILRPRPEFDARPWQRELLERMINPPMVVSMKNSIYMNRKTYHALKQMAASMLRIIDEPPIHWVVVPEDEGRTT